MWYYMPDIYFECKNLYWAGRTRRPDSHNKKNQWYSSRQPSTWSTRSTARASTRYNPSSSSQWCGFWRPGFCWAWDSFSIIPSLAKIRTTPTNKNAGRIFVILVIQKGTVKSTGMLLPSFFNSIPISSVLTIKLLWLFFNLCFSLVPFSDFL